MGLIKFIKDAGSKLLGQDDAAQQAPAAAAPAAAARTEATNDAMRALSLMRHVKALGFAVEGLKIEVDGDTCRVSGEVADQATKEKIALAVGNTAGIGAVDDRLEIAAPKAVFHTVVSGDSLSKIAREHYGDASKYPVIFEANKPMLEHPDKIFPGQVLRIPPLG
ncbi:MAG: peptidoglycan-binding protein LysM [Acidobacteriota bacterium]|nr:peptidoglycan-binding protein LysM [Acidobacteriota bacterium]MDH3524920.1 peptidoglycan-binding protein LysM [Acidobacteriota bacterium]